MSRKAFIICTMILMLSELKAQRLYIGVPIRPAVGFTQLKFDRSVVVGTENLRTFFITDDTQQGLAWDAAIGTEFILDYGLVQFNFGYLYAFKNYTITAETLGLDNEIVRVTSNINQDEFEFPLTLGLTLFRQSTFSFYIDGGANFNLYLTGHEVHSGLQSDGSLGFRSIEGRSFLNQFYGKNYFEPIVGAGVRWRRLRLILRRYFGSETHPLGKIQQMAFTLTWFNLNKNQYQQVINYGDL